MEVLFIGGSRDGERATWEHECEHIEAPTAPVMPLFSKHANGDVTGSAMFERYQRINVGIWLHAMPLAFFAIEGMLFPDILRALHAGYQPVQKELQARTDARNRIVARRNQSRYED